jgi:Dehydrogenase E1 component
MTTTATDPRLQLEQHLHMYRQMAKIRAFEEQVNELYKGAKMPGLAHLYVGEEAVAVGVCEALRRDDFITSTHRGHGHCLAKGAAENPDVRRRGVLHRRWRAGPGRALRRDEHGRPLEGAGHLRLREQPLSRFPRIGGRPSASSVRSET